MRPGISANKPSPMLARHVLISTLQHLWDPHAGDKGTEEQVLRLGGVLNQSGRIHEHLV